MTNRCLLGLALAVWIAPTAVLAQDEDCTRLGMFQLSGFGVAFEGHVTKVVITKRRTHTFGGLEEGRFYVQPDRMVKGDKPLRHSPISFVHTWSDDLQENGVLPQRGARIVVAQHPVREADQYWLLGDVCGHTINYDWPSHPEPPGR